MPDQQDEQRDRVRRHLERQYEIDLITAQYAEEVRGGRKPRIEDYIRRYPQYTAELMSFVLYFESIGIDTEALSGTPDVELSPAARTAQKIIRERRAAESSTQLPVTAIQGLVVRGQEVGYQPPQLAAAVGLTMALLGKLEARVITVATIPPTLVRRLATALRVAPEAVATFLGAARPGAAGVFYYADQPPAQQQEPFLDAVQGSTLPNEAKQEWVDIVRADAGGGA
jgi:hypothetical protein